MASAQDAAHGLLLHAQATGAAVLGAGVRYRGLFAWLLMLCRRLGEDAAAAAAGGAARRPGFQQDPIGMAAFLKGQFSHDTVRPHLSQEVGAMHLGPVPIIRPTLRVYQSTVAWPD